MHHQRRRILRIPRQQAQRLLRHPEAPLHLQHLDPFRRTLQVAGDHVQRPANSDRNRHLQSIAMPVNPDLLLRISECHQKESPAWRLQSCAASRRYPSRAAALSRANSVPRYSHPDSAPSKPRPHAANWPPTTPADKSHILFQPKAWPAPESGPRPSPAASTACGTA